jgi:hypothetical protein
MVDMAVTANSDGEKDRNPAKVVPMLPPLHQSILQPLRLLPTLPEK